MTARWIDRPGIYDLDEATYHADPTPEPSLSSGAAKLLIERSPRHAWNASRRLNPFWKPTNGQQFDIGRLMHALLLGDEHSTVTVLDVEDFRSKEARVARDLAYETGKIPVTQAQYDRALHACDAVTSQLDETPFIRGRPEQSLFWQDIGEVWCRARVDWLPDDPDRGIIIDVKSTTNAQPDVFARHIYTMGYDIQEALYLRGIRALTGATRTTWKFLAVEVDPPFACSLVDTQPAARALSNRKVEYALRRWGECLKTEFWPAYGGGTYTAEMPAFVEQRWIAREEISEGEVAAAISWQAPA